jgi:sterol desaturase/sphingolipid hydroxylase (fatty acid hydroxylase superfamily)
MSIWDFPTKPAPGPGTCRMFQTDIIERYSRIHPAVAFSAWLPVIGFVLYRIAARHELTLGGVLGLIVLGVFSWTLTEYLLHRFLFHYIDDSPRGRRIHFIVHGVHHEYPSDKGRLVMPLTVSMPLGVICYGLFALLFGIPIAEPIFIGFGGGYLAYDGIHWAVHHVAMPIRAFRWLKKHHMQHHHADHEGGFGVSSPLWDLVFRTMPRPAKRMGASTMARIG